MTRRILMTADAAGGVWTYALDLAEGLAAAGAEVVLAVLGPPPLPDQAARAAAIPGVTLRPTGLPLDWLAASAGAVIEAGRALAALARDVGADLVHLNTPAHAADAGFAAPVVAVSHSCTATWWDAVRGGDLPPDFAWRADLMRRGLTAASAVVVPGHAFARATARRYALPRPPVVVRNGRRPAPPAAPVPGAPAVFALTAGRLWDAGKDVGTLDRAAARLDLPVLAAGPVDGPDGTRVLLRHARPLGRLDEATLASWMACRPIYVSPALYEPFGLAVLEAAGAGCPLVLSDTPGFRELWDGAALFVPPRDAEALAGAVSRLAADPAARDALGRAARARAARLTPEAMVAGMASVYAGLATPGNAAL